MENTEQNAKQHLQPSQQSYIQQVIETPIREIFALIAAPILYASCKYPALKLFHAPQQQPHQYEYYYKVAYVFFDTLVSTIFYEKLGVSIKNSARSLFDYLYPMQSMEGEQEINLYTPESKPYYIANNTCYFYSRPLA